MRRNISRDLLRAFNPKKKPPGSNSSWVVKGIKIAVCAVVRVRSMPMHFLPIGKMLFMASRCSKGKVSARQVFFCTVDMICLMRLSNSALVSALVCIIRQILNSFWLRFISSSNNSSAFLMFSLNS